MKTKNIPISAAKQIAKKYNWNQIIIVGFGDYDGNMEGDVATSATTHVTTYGTSIKDCLRAAANGNTLKRHWLKWPEDKCNDAPKGFKIKGK